MDLNNHVGRRGLARLKRLIRKNGPKDQQFMGSNPIGGLLFFRKFVYLEFLHGSEIFLPVYKLFINRF